MRRVLLLLIVLVLAWISLWAQSTPVQFIFTADSHYGLKRQSFHGATNVDASVVNRAMIATMQALPKTVGPIDFVAVGGDIANRAEQSDILEIQTAATSWAQFHRDYIDGLHLPLYVVPGNHDASNAIGYFRTLVPSIDKAAMAGIYNFMMSPPSPRTPATYDYAKDKILVSHDVRGVHFVFLTLWPDSATRAWMEKDLQRVSAQTPVIVFAHDPPDSDPKHFINPNGSHDINATDQFENVLGDVFVDPLVARQALEAFLRRHPNVVAYFHGHNNWNEFYDWNGLHVFRVDSPMKGKLSATDETQLSYQLATIDMAHRTMKVREVLWNVEPVTWGASTSFEIGKKF